MKGERVIKIAFSQGQFERRRRMPDEQKNASSPFQPAPHGEAMPDND
jgi:hypothetical protein